MMMMMINDCELVVDAGVEEDEAFHFHFLTLFMLSVRSGAPNWRATHENLEHVGSVCSCTHKTKPVFNAMFRFQHFFEDTAPRH